MYLTVSLTNEPAVCCSSESTNFKISIPLPLKVVEIVSTLLTVCATPGIVTSLIQISSFLFGRVILS